MSVDWGDLYRTCYQELVRFLHRRVWDEDRAHDLAQETFVRALGQEREPENPRAWLFRVALNLARDEARLVVRRRRHLALLKSEPIAPAEPPEPEREMETKRRAEMVRGALEALSERDRDVLLLWDAGLRYAELAAQTGLAPGAIGTTLARARRRLVEAFQSLEETNAARG